MFNKGDFVRIKENFNKLRFDDDPRIDPYNRMLNYAGTVTEIRSIHGNSELEHLWYRVTDNDFFWDGRWLEPAGTEFKPVTENELFDLLGE